MSDSKYCYPDSEVLINKYSITDSEKLNTVERQITTSKEFELKVHPLKGTFDLKHLQTIHKHIFSDLYEWAGKLRDVDIAKTRMFCRSQFIVSMANEIFSKLKKDNYLRDLSKSEFIDKLSYYMGEVNALHPFREGNGRTQRNFFIELSKQAGYVLDFSTVNKERLLQVDIAAMDGDYAPLKSILNNIVEKNISPVIESAHGKQQKKLSVLNKLNSYKEKAQASHTCQSKRKDIDISD